MKKHGIVFVMLLVFVFVIASCGDDDDDDSGGNSPIDDDDDSTDDDDDTGSDDDDDSTESGLLPLNVLNGRIVDSNGGTVILRGVGVNQLGDYFQGNPDILPVLPLEKRDFEMMAALGLNSVRLVINWSYLEPERGVYDEVYIAKVKEAVEWAREYGIYVILDMHQDAWGKYIATPPDEECSGIRKPNVGWDGAPEWATITDGLSTCILETRELSPAVMRAWESFWSDRDDIQQHFINTWARLASEFLDDPVIAGYNIINEPNWGEHLFDCIHTHKPAMHRRVLEAIRQLEGDGHHKIIFFEPSALWSFYPKETPVLFTDDPDIVYAPHIYNSINGVLYDILGYDLVGVETNFENAAAEAQTYGCPFWVGEWWGSEMEQASKVAELEDRYQIGSARWLWKVSCGDPHFMAGCWPYCEGLVEAEKHSVIHIQCGDPDFPEGKELGYTPTDTLILSRPYPRSFPSPATYIVDPDTPLIEMEGDSPGGIPLVIWFPGDAEPTWQAEGLGDPVIERVDGGWLIFAEPDIGEWRVSVGTAADDDDDTGKMIDVEKTRSFTINQPPSTP